MGRKVTFDGLVAEGEKPDFSRLRWRVLYILKEQYGDNKSEMARDINAESSAIGNWIRRDQGMEHTYAYRLRDKYRWNDRWILEGEGDEKLPPPLTSAEKALLERYRENPRSALELILDSL